MTDLTLDGETFRVEVDGDATKPALLLSNSLGTDLSLWDGQMPALAAHFRVIRYDARGHGGSVAGEGPYSIDQLGRDALAILDALEIDTAHVMGVSMGGAVAQWLMINAPGRIGRAVLANTTARFMNPEIWNTRISAVLRDGMDGPAAATIERWFSSGFRDEAPDRVRSVHEILRKTPPHGYAACSAALRDMDLTEQIRDIEHPVLIVSGADDPAISAEDTARFLDAIGDSRHLEFDTRHLSNIEAGTAFTDAVVAFLTARTPAKRTRRAAVPARPSRKSTGLARRVVRRSSAARAPLPKITSAKTTSAKVASLKVAPAQSGQKTTKTVPSKAQSRAGKVKPAAPLACPSVAKSTKKTPASPPPKLARSPRKTAKTSPPPRASAAKAAIGKASRGKTRANATSTRPAKTKPAKTKTTSTKAAKTKAAATKAATKAAATRSAATKAAATRSAKNKQAPGKAAPQRSATIKSTKAKATSLRATTPARKSASPKKPVPKVAAATKKPPRTKTPKASPGTKASAKANDVTKSPRKAARGASPGKRQ